MKYTPEGGKVDFLIEEISPKEHQGWVRYRFTVSDTGVGMSEAFMEHMFEPFIRSENTNRVEGTGLGLSITKGLIDLMGGSVSVKSKVHEGTTFEIELECEPAQADIHEGEMSLESCSSQAFARSVFTGKTFLIAEDNAINAEILCELLSMRGAKSVVVQNGALAVQAFSDAVPGTYDAIFMDIQMPQMNGYEAARGIRQIEREDAARIPIIAMTANAFAEDVREAMDAGMNAHVAKPVDMKVVEETLKKVVGKQRAN